MSDRVALGESVIRASAHALTQIGREIGESRTAVQRIVEAAEAQRGESDSVAREIESLAEIAENLNAQGIEGKRGGRWYASTVRYLIQRQAA